MVIDRTSILKSTPKVKSLQESYPQFFLDIFSILHHNKTMYKVNVVIQGKNGTILLEKNLKGEHLEVVLKINGADLYVEAQQEEIKKGLDLITDEELDSQYNELN